MEPIGCPETSVHYNSTLLDIHRIARISKHICLTGINITPFGCATLLPYITLPFVRKLLTAFLHGGQNLDSNGFVPTCDPFLFAYVQVFILISARLTALWSVSKP